MWVVRDRYIVCIYKDR